MISIIVKDQELTKALTRLLDNSQNTSPAMAGIAAAMLGAVEDNFRAEGRPRKWPALTASTLATRAARGKSGKILQATGKLAASNTPFHSTNTAGVGTNVPYAAAMNFGSKPHVIKPKNKKALAFGGRFFKRVNHPGTKPRPFYYLSDMDRADIIQIMGRHLIAGV